MDFGPDYIPAFDRFIKECAQLLQQNQGASEASKELVSEVIKVAQILRKLGEKENFATQSWYLKSQKEEIKKLTNKVINLWPQATDELTQQLFIKSSELLKNAAADPSKFIKFGVVDIKLLKLFKIKINPSINLTSFFQSLDKWVFNQIKTIDLYIQGKEVLTKSDEIVKKFPSLENNKNENNNANVTSIKSFQVIVKDMMSMPPQGVLSPHMGESSKLDRLFVPITAGSWVLQEFLQKENEFESILFQQEQEPPNNLPKLFERHCTKESNAQFREKLNDVIDKFVQSIEAYKISQKPKKKKLALLLQLELIIKIKQSQLLSEEYNPYTNDYFKMLSGWKFFSDYYKTVPETDEQTTKRFQAFLNLTNEYFKKFKEICEEKFGNNFALVYFVHNNMPVNLGTEVLSILSVTQIHSSESVKASKERFDNLNVHLQNLGGANLFVNVPGFKELSKDILDMLREIKETMDEHDKYWDSEKHEYKKAPGRTGDILNDFYADIINLFSQLTLEHDPFVRLRTIAHAQFVNDTMVQNYHSKQEKEIQVQSSNTTQVGSDNRMKDEEIFNLPVKRGRGAKKPIALGEVNVEQLYTAPSPEELDALRKKEEQEKQVKPQAEPVKKEPEETILNERFEGACMGPSDPENTPEKRAKHILANWPNSAKRSSLRKSQRLQKVLVAREYSSERIAKQLKEAANSGPLIRVTEPAPASVPDVPHSPPVTNVASKPVAKNLIVSEPAPQTNILKNILADLTDILEANKSSVWFLLIALIAGLTFAGVAAIVTVFTVGGTTPLTGLLGLFGLSLAWKSSVLLAANIGMGFVTGIILGVMTDVILWAKDVFKPKEMKPVQDVKENPSILQYKGIMDRNGVGLCVSDNQQQHFPNPAGCYGVQPPAPPTAFPFSEPQSYVPELLINKK